MSMKDHKPFRQITVPDHLWDRLIARYGNQAPKCAVITLLLDEADDNDASDEAYEEHAQHVDSNYDEHPEYRGGNYGNE